MVSKLQQMMSKDKHWNSPTNQYYLRDQFISEKLGQYDNYKQWEKEQYREEKEREKERERRKKATKHLKH